MRTRPSKNYTGADLAIGTVLGFVAVLSGVAVVTVVVVALERSGYKNAQWLPVVTGLGACLVGLVVGRRVARGLRNARWRWYADGRKLAIRALRCPHCDYDLRGTVEPRCPECGEQFTAQEWALTSAEHRV